MVQEVIDVEYLDGYRLEITFESGEKREVDIAGFVRFDGVFEPLSDLDYFQQVRVNPDIGTIMWPNGADLCPDVLYQVGRPCGSGLGNSRTTENVSRRG